MDQIWQNVARKTREHTKWTTMKLPTATMTTTSHETPTPSAEIMELRGLVARQTAKTTWQHDYGQSGQHHVFEDW